MEVSTNHMLFPKVHTIQNLVEVKFKVFVLRGLEERFIGNIGVLISVLATFGMSIILVAPRVRREYLPQSPNHATYVHCSAKVPSTPML